MAVSSDPKLRMTDTAEVLNISRRSVIRLIDSGDLPSFKFGGSVRISESDLLAYIERSRRDVAPPTPPRRRSRRTRKAVAV